MHWWTTFDYRKWRTFKAPEQYFKERSPESWEWSNWHGWNLPIQLIHRWSARLPNYGTDPSMVGKKGQTKWTQAREHHMGRARSRIDADDHPNSNDSRKGDGVHGWGRVYSGGHQESDARRGRSIHQDLESEDVGGHPKVPASRPERDIPGQGDLLVFPRRRWMQAWVRELYNFSPCSRCDSDCPGTKSQLWNIHLRDSLWSDLAGGDASSSGVRLSLRQAEERQRAQRACR